MARPIFLSKSKIMSARHCLKRLHLEIRHPELKVVTADTEAAFRKGHEVGEMARQIYGAENSTIIPFDGGLKHALAKTSRLLQLGPEAPIFEATVQYQNVLVRIDVLLPDAAGWRLVEVKAATSVKSEHAFDSAIQAWTFSRSGYELTQISLSHVDSSMRVTAIIRDCWRKKISATMWLRSYHQFPNGQRRRDSLPATTNRIYLSASNASHRMSVPSCHTAGRRTTSTRFLASADERPKKCLAS